MRVDVMKTYKLYIGGAFPRSESGRSYELKDKKGNFIANPALASRKDLRDAVVAAKSAFSGWSHATAFNRGQILYRMAEMLEGRTEQFVAEIKALEGVSDSVARKQVQDAIDLWVWYAGWTDKISTTSGGTNPIAGPYYNFTIPEPLGVIGVIADEKESLLGLTRGLAPVIASGNTAVLIASEKLPLSAISLAEVMATSDLPAGVVNILTGSKSELVPWLASHMEIDGIDISGADKKLDGEIKRAGTENLKRIYRFEKDASLKRILSFMEYKTVWHPIGI
ncbi:MAG: aldehyde dehydrogenase family protein [Actinobacteria bacterium]|jgi:acyl-CoA reductase-like NAD-dependent aldehyde dehydrogenase|nr:aldehyde dehydrogenase family protein [Actinomycetota bacterium]NCW94076.1 aldehyde dehydrogenase family protein [Actinomycetota bacterium]